VVSLVLVLCCLFALTDRSWTKCSFWSRLPREYHGLHPDVQATLTTGFHLSMQIAQILLQHIGVNVKEVYDSVSDALIGLNKAMTVISHGKLYFMGDRLGFVDIMFAPMIPWFQVLKVLDNYNIPDATMCPRLHQWLSALKKHPSVRPSLEDSSPNRLKALISQHFREIRT
jgi:glutathione S-transferase